jgi:uncharacterized protein
VQSTPSGVVVDTGPIIAFFDTRDAYHARAVEFMQGTRAKLLTSMAAITEAMYVSDESLITQKNLLAWIRRGGLTLIEPEGGDFDRIAELMDKYANLPMDFTDAVLVALCERLGIHHIASVDRDFSIYRYKGRSKFVNVFSR